jgi:hypothetical protein
MESTNKRDATSAELDHSSSSAAEEEAPKIPRIVETTTTTDSILRTIFGEIRALTGNEALFVDALVLLEHEEIVFRFGKDTMETQMEFFMSHGVLPTPPEPFSAEDSQLNHMYTLTKAVDFAAFLLLSVAVRTGVISTNNQNKRDIRTRMGLTLTRLQVHPYVIRMRALSKLVRDFSYPAPISGQTLRSTGPTRGFYSQDGHFISNTRTIDKRLHYLRAVLPRAILHFARLQARDLAARRAEKEE